MKKVKLLCPASSAVIAEIEVEEGSTLSARAIRTGGTVLSPRRMPLFSRIQDGEQMTCRRCGNALLFEIEGGQTFAAMPGSLEVEG